MATFRLPHLAAAHVLRAVDRDRLLRFLSPYRDYLAGRGLDLPAAGDPGDVPYDALVAVFMAPEANTPARLIDALFYVDGMATPEGMHALLAAAAEIDLDLGPAADLTPALPPTSPRPTSPSRCGSTPPTDSSGPTPSSTSPAP
ncbi:hypothetical protein J0H58_11665, partial [bacterium]|nr:hypothetical protein [bacterium]